MEAVQEGGRADGAHHSVAGRGDTTGKPRPAQVSSHRFSPIRPSPTSDPSRTGCGGGASGAKVMLLSQGRCTRGCGVGATGLHT